MVQVSKLAQRVESYGGGFLFNKASGGAFEHNFLPGFKSWWVHTLILDFPRSFHAKHARSSKTGKSWE